MCRGFNGIIGYEPLVTTDEWNELLYHSTPNKPFAFSAFRARTMQLRAVSSRMRHCGYRAVQRPYSTANVRAVWLILSALLIVPLILLWLLIRDKHHECMDLNRNGCSLKTKGWSGLLVFRDQDYLIVQTTTRNITTSVSSFLVVRLWR